MRILSLGAGVQSSTIALMAERGETDPIDAAVFADTQAEPAGVYVRTLWMALRGDDLEPARDWDD